jgi:N-acyl homoserine lactone hydrolase
MPSSIQRFSPERRSLQEELAQLGVGTKDISAVINSHLHFDHCGNNRLFAGIPTYIHRREFQAAQAPGYTVREWFDFEGARIELVDGDQQFAPGVKLIATPGHTPGHQSVAIESQGILMLIAAQAASSADEFRAGGNVAEAHEGFAETYLSTIAQLKLLGPAEAYFSHDRAPWRP